jgi:hypothetical protein
VVAFATYNYRVRAYKDTMESDNSNEAACFQLDLQTLLNNVQMSATFQPDVTSLSQAAGAFGYTHFNWMSLLTYAKHDPIKGLKDANGAQLPFPPPPLVDPPFGGWSYLPADNLPYFWNEQVGFDVNYWVTQHMNPTISPTKLDFNDLPVVPWWVPSDHYEFITHLVGVTLPFGSSLPAQFRILASFAWSTNFTALSGSIFDYRIYNLVPPEQPGPGGIFNAHVVDERELPVYVKTVLTNSGAQGLSTTAKVDNDAPATAAFLSGTQGSNGWYTGPVTVTLIATDIDGPSDIAATS